VAKGRGFSLRGRFDGMVELKESNYQHFWATASVLETFTFHN
jgi:hypothetical protein